MACFCQIPLQNFSSCLEEWMVTFTPPKIPLPLKLMANLPLWTDPERRDLRLQAIEQAQRIVLPPTIQPGTEYALQLFRLQKIIAPEFPMGNVPLFKAHMDQACYTFNTHAASTFEPMLAIDPVPLMRLAEIAALKIGTPATAYKAALQTGIFPFEKLAGLPIPPLAFPKTDVLPWAMMAIPQLDPGSLPDFAAVPPPQIDMNPAEITKLAGMMKSIALIQEAWGPNALTLPVLRNIATELEALSKIPVPWIEPPDPDLEECLPMLPDPENLCVDNQAIFLGNSKPANLDFEPPLTALATLLGAFREIDLPGGSCGDACQVPLSMFEGDGAPAS